jgi:hypothetical protein
MVGVMVKGSSTTSRTKENGKVRALSDERYSFVSNNIESRDLTS